MSRDLPSVIRVLVTVTNISTLPRSVPGINPGMMVDGVAIQRFWALSEPLGNGASDLCGVHPAETHAFK
ncbi:MAG TPA: hypothetical protein VHX39_32770, partial [Acetobacteraceae bacterium]|nr:hypothetical protein [Acetobacteraceae bacterium]